MVRPFRLAIFSAFTFPPLRRGLLLAGMVVCLPAFITLALAYPLPLSQPTPGITLLAANDNGLLIDVVAPALSRLPAADPQYEQISLIGYGRLETVGWPELPQTSFFVALPPGAEAELKLLSSDSRQLSGLMVQPTGKSA